MKNKISIVKNLLWKFGERCGAQLVSFIVSLVLARLVEPAIYGQLAIVLSLITILQVFIDNGLGNSLIQNKESDAYDFSSIFYFNLFLSIILYISIFILSPYIANIYNNELLIIYIRVMSLNVIISSVKNTQQAYVAKNLMFKKFFFSTIIGTTLSGIIGIYMAYNEFGIWALIFYYLFKNIFDTLILWFSVKWRPILYFSFSRIKKMLPFGMSIFFSSLFNTIYGELRQLLIGKKYSNSDLAYYNRARQFPLLLVDNINGTIDGVLFPAMSMESQNKETLKKIAKKTIVISTYLFAPLLLGLASISKEIVVFLLTEKWIFCVPYIEIFCIIYFFQPLQIVNKICIKSNGKGDILIKQEIINNILGIIIVLLFINYGVYAIAIGYLISNTLDLIVNSYPNKELLNYSLYEQVKDIMPIVLLAVSMSFIVYIFPGFGLPLYMILIIKTFIGIFYYILLSKAFKINAFYDSLDIIKILIKKI